MKTILTLLTLCLVNYQLRAQVSFTNSSSFSVGNAPSCVITADVNGDGKPDLITANYGNAAGNTLSVLTNNGSGGFALASSPVVGTGPRWVTAADVNGDGKLDLIASNYGNNGNQNTLSVLTNSGNGIFALASSPVLTSASFAVLALDINGDGKMDLISANSDNTVEVLTNNGSGGFALASSSNLGGNPRSIVAFTNVDGKVDLISANQYNNTLSFMTNNGSGGFGLAALLSGGSQPFQVTVADVNGDGKMDVISANYGNNTLSVWTNNGGGGFGLASSPAVGNQPFMVAAADVNADGKVDLISANYGDSTLSVLTNNGSGGFGLAAILPATNNPEAVAASDVNGDGRIDLISANGGNSTVTVWLNAAQPQCDPPPAGLVSWWAAEGNAMDSVGTNNGTLVGSASFTNGEVGQAFSFDGSSGYVSIPDSPLMDSFTTNMTIELWLKSGQLTANSDWVGLVTKGNLSWRLQGLTGAKTIDWAMNGVTPLELRGTRNVNDGLWHHVAAVYDGIKTYLYIDGTLDISQPASGSISETGDPVCIGKTYGAFGSDLFNGSLDEVSIYNRALSPSEIQAIYNASTNGKCPAPPAVPSIISQPTNQTVVIGQSASFSVNAAGTAPLSYQWNFNGTNISGATNTVLTLSNVQPSNAGNYAVLISNPYGSTNSTIAILTVSSPILPAPVPVINGIAPASAVAGTSIAIAGTNFSSNAASNLVYFGAVRASVVSASATNLMVTVPIGATFAPITVTVNGLTAYANQPFMPTFAGSGSGISTSSFAARQDLSAGNNPYHVVIADIDGDGKPDLVVANVFGNTISVYRNISTNGSLTSASFAPRVDFATTTGTYAPCGLAVADVDGDGKLDIVTTDESKNFVSIFRNTSTPGSITTNSFAARVDFVTGSQPQGVEVRDIDGDGRPELLVANSGDGTLSIFRNIGSVGSLTTNSFAARMNISTGSGCVSIVTGDLDGDGKPDVAVANSGSSTVSLLRNISVPGTIAFSPKADFAVPNAPVQLAIGDLDGDGKLDLTVAGYLSQTISVLRNTSTVGSLTTNSFAPRNDFSLGGRGHTPALADLEGDGKPDIAVVTELNSLLSIFSNISTPGNFTNTSLAARIDFGAGWNAWGVSIGDLDGDGRPDVVFCNQYDGTISIYQNQVPFNSPPVIITQPTNQTVLAGGTATFTVTAGGSFPQTYQWSCNSTNVVGATNATLILADVQLAQAGNYAVQISNTLGATNSASATLTVVLPPVITTQPQSQSVLSFQSAGFMVAATGTGPINFQWRKNGTNLSDGGNISGSLTTNLNLAAVTLADAGNYDVVVSSPYATTNSAVAILTVPQTALSIGSASAMSGTTLTVPITMNALGVENTFLASVGYDTSKLVLQSVQLGQATAGAYLQEVDTQTNNGLVGFAILLNNGAVVPAGTQQVAQIVFNTLPVTNSVTTSLTFGDTPTSRQVLDNNFDVLPATYLGGTISLTPAEYEADVYPRTNGDHQVSVQDWLEVGRMVAGLDVVTNSDEMLRADCAPRNAPDGILTVADWVQAGRYALGLDPLTLVPPPLVSQQKVTFHGSPAPTRTVELATVSAQRGQTVSVPVLLISSTNENAVGLTVTYNSSQLKYLSTALGSALSSGRLNINTNPAAGKVGLALALSPGASLAAGTNQIAVLQFQTATNAVGNLPLILDSSVVQLQVADKTAVALTANYVNGAVSLPPAPTVQTLKVGNNLTLAWPISAGSYVVQSANSPTGPWSNAPQNINTNGINANVTVQATNQQQFYRLLGQ